ncbi:hypothetical protein EDC04DRAFT_2887074 [Pisolithus marmoratus]|nr:hypothetical protein EDC04DRAFT_2887074 [Pisolithus marmoratus]
MPFDMFKLFRNRRDHGDIATLEGNHGERGRRYLLRRTSKVKAGTCERLLSVDSACYITLASQIFTPLPSRAPTDPEEEYRDGYVQVDSPSTVMGGTLNARPTTLEGPISPSSPRGHSHRLEYPRLHDDIPYADTYHEGMTERGNPERPIVINHSSRGMSSTSSDRTLQNHRSAAPGYPGTRVIPPPPHHHPRNYVAAETPTNIYGSRHHDAHPEAGGIRRAEDHRRGQTRSHSKGRPPIYYIVPGGMRVIFQDEAGREIDRVGDFSGRRRPVPPAPFVVQDESGRELYRYDGHPHRQPPVVEYNPNRRGRRYSSPMYPSESYKRYNDPRYDHRSSVERRGYGRYGDYENHRNRPGHSTHRDARGYDDYRDRGDYRRHGDYPRRAGHEVPRNHGEHEDHRGYEDFGSHGQPERDSPELHRARSHSDHVPLGEPHDDLLQ